MAEIMQNNPDLTLGVEFFVKAVENKRKSEEAGRPIFDEREYVRIRFPADNKRELVAPAQEMHYVSAQQRQMTYAERFAGSYQAFKDKVADFVEGTPLSEAPFLAEARRAELNALNIKTVEQLAGLTTQAMRKIGMGGSDLVQKAQAYLDSAAGSSEVADLKAQIEALKAQITSQGQDDPYSDFTDDDLVNMINDADGVVPKGPRVRAKLVAELERLRAEKERELA